MYPTIHTLAHLWVLQRNCITGRFCWLVGLSIGGLLKALTIHMAQFVDLFGHVNSLVSPPLLQKINKHILTHPGQEIQSQIRYNCSVEDRNYNLISCFPVRQTRVSL